MKNLLFIFIFLFSCSKQTETTKPLLDDQTFIMVDYKIPSYKNRLFVIHNNNIIFESLVCSGITNGEVIFSNVPESHCSSKGKIEILNSYYGNYGKAYKLKGLDPTNDNIYKRNIVLHSHSCVPYEEVNYPICNSQGCLTMNPNKFNQLDDLIRTFKIKHIIVI